MKSLIIKIILLAVLSGAIYFVKLLTAPGQEIKCLQLLSTTDSRWAELVKQYSKVEITEHSGTIPKVIVIDDYDQMIEFLHIIEEPSSEPSSLKVHAYPPDLNIVPFREGSPLCSIRIYYNSSENDYILHVSETGYRKTNGSQLRWFLKKVDNTKKPERAP